jgi:hypothetical protein
LTLAQADQAQLKVALAGVDADSVLREIEHSLGPLAKAERKVILTASAHSGLKVVADRARLIQVLSNLVRNAIAHTPKGGLVSVSARRGGFALRGTGSHRHRLWHQPRGPATHLRPLLPELERLAAGLRTRPSVAWELVQAMGGALSAESSTFTVSLNSG